MNTHKTVNCSLQNCNLLLIFWSHEFLHMSCDHMRISSINYEKNMETLVYVLTKFLIMCSVCNLIPPLNQKLI